MQIEIVGNRINLGFGYDPRLIAVVKSAPDGRRWNPTSKRWEVNLTVDNARHLLKNGIGNGDLTKAISDMEKPLLADEMTTVQFKTAPFAHQRLGFNLAINNDQCFLMWEMGTGKSWLAVNAIGYRFRMGQIRRVLIMCPKVVIGSWVKEFQRHSDLTPAAIGDDKDRAKTICKPIVVMNYDQLIHIKDLVTAQPWDMIVLDESHTIKSTSAKRTKIVWELAKKCKYRLLLTGTPVTNGPEDLFSQFKALDDGHTFGQSFFAFRNKYFYNVGKNFPNWKIKPGAIDDIKAKMATKSHRVTKDQCFDLPPKNYQVVEVEMMPEQKRIYKEIEKELYTLIDTAGGIEELKIEYAITKLMKLNQVTSGFVKNEDHIIDLEHQKLSTLMELVADKPKAVIWCLFIHDIDKIMHTLHTLNIEAVEISGRISGEDRAINVERFQTDPSVRILVGQVHAGGIGITLTASNFVMYYSQGYSLTDRQQSEDRTHRIGTTGVVTYVDLVCRGTIDEDILDALENKRQTAGYLTGDNVRQVLNKFVQRRTHV